MSLSQCTSVGNNVWARWHPVADQEIVIQPVGYSVKFLGAWCWPADRVTFVPSHAKRVSCSSSLCQAKRLLAVAFDINRTHSGDALLYSLCKKS